MACEVKWSRNALEERKVILAYWIEHNQSADFSIKLDSLIRKTIELIAKHPSIGRPTKINGVRVKGIRSYLIIYEYLENEILILSVWDGRRNPETGII